MRQINHKDLELNISEGCNCDDQPQLKIAGYYPYYNKITVAAQRGEDKFVLAARDPKSDISNAIPLLGRYLLIGDVSHTEDEIFRQCIIENPADTWQQIPSDLYTSRLLVAGAVKIIISSNNLSDPITSTVEYAQAVADGRVIVV